MLGRKNKSDKTEVAEEKVLEINASMQGTMSFKEPVNLMITGDFQGNLDALGKLTIGKNASVRASIIGESIIVEGEIVGDVKASKSIEMGPTGRLIGDVETPSLAMKAGAVLQGQLNMLSAKKSTVTDSSSTSLNEDELASYLSVERSLINEWADNGKLPGVKKGQGWRFDKKKVDEWVASGRIK